MAMSYVGQSSATDAGSNISVVINKPTGVQAGDLLLATYMSNDNFWNLPDASWTALESTLGGGSNVRAGLAYKLAGASEPSTYTFTKDVASGDGAPLVVTMMAIRGVDQTSPIQDSAAESAGAVSAGADPNDTLTVAQNSAPGRLIFWRNSRAQNASGGGTATGVPSFSESSSGWDMASNDGAFSGGSVYYATGSAYTGDFGSTSSSRGTMAGGMTASQPTTGNIYFFVSLLGSTGPVVSANAGGATPQANAYGPAALVKPSAVTPTAATVQAHNAGVLTGVAAEDVPGATATATAFNAKPWVIFPSTAGATAYGASVAVETEAGHAALSATAQASGGYFGAPASRRWRIAAEKRTWAIRSESRVWRIPSED